jgi:hypothetical protein
MSLYGTEWRGSVAMDSRYTDIRCRPESTTRFWRFQFWHFPRGLFQSFLFSLGRKIKKTGKFYASVQHFFEDNTTDFHQEIGVFFTQNMISQLLIIFAEVRILLPHPYTIPYSHGAFIAVFTAIFMLV